MRSCMCGLSPALTRRPVLRAGFVVALLLGVVGLAGSSAVATASSGGPAQEFAYGSTYDRFTGAGVPQTGWNTPAFAENGDWHGQSAPFGNTPGQRSYCSANGGYDAAGLPQQANSGFALGSTIYLRKSFAIPANAFGMHIVGTIDNFVDVWVNGTPEGASPITGGGCSTGDINLWITNSDLDLGGQNLVAVQAADDGNTASFFDMKASYGAIQFGQQPSEVQMGAAITPAPTVTVVDADGNPVAGTTVTVSLQAIAGSGALSGNASAVTDSTGVATFSNLSVSDGGEYVLVATSQGATVTSNSFVVADQITPCSGSCSASGSSSGTTINAAALNAGSSSLAVSVFAGTPPAGVCDNLAPLGATAVVNFVNPASGTPSLQVVWTLDKSLVMQAGNPGAAHFNICLGAENLQHPDGTGVTPWTTKDGIPATPVGDPVLGATLFWGVVPDCPNHGTPTGPCVLHRDKNAGNEVITIYKPYPWDGRMYGG